MAVSAEDIDYHGHELQSLITRLRQMDLQAWRCEGRDLVNWMNREANDMAKAESEVAITKVTGGAAQIVGAGLFTGVGIVGSFLTFGLAAPLAVAGVAFGFMGALTLAGGGIAQLSIIHMKTCKIKERCETFRRNTEGVLSILMEMGQLMSLRSLHNNSDNVGTGVKEDLLKSCESLVNAGMQAGKIIKEITQLQKSGVLLGADFPTRFAGIGASALGFGIWEVVDASGTLVNGGSNASLIRDNASQINNTIKDIEKALQQLDL